MLSFWIATLFLCLIAILFILIPLKKAQIIANRHSNQLNITLYRHRLQELQAEYEAGLFTKEQLPLAKIELQQNLLIDTETADVSDVNLRPSDKKVAIKNSGLIAIILMLAIPGITYILYWHLGSYKQVLALTEAKQTALQAQRLPLELGSPEQLIVMLKQHLAQDPTSARGWFLLGKLYVSQRDFLQATQAFAKANELQPHDPVILFQYAQAQYFEAIKNE